MHLMGYVVNLFMPVNLVSALTIGGAFVLYGQMKTMPIELKL